MRYTSFGPLYFLRLTIIVSLPIFLFLKIIVTLEHLLFFPIIIPLFIEFHPT